MANSAAYNQHYRELDLINSTAEREERYRMSRMRRIRLTLEAARDEELTAMMLYWGS